MNDDLHHAELHVLNLCSDNSEPTRRDFVYAVRCAHLIVLFVQAAARLSLIYIMSIDFY